MLLPFRTPLFSSRGVIGDQGLPYSLQLEDTISDTSTGLSFSQDLQVYDNIVQIFLINYHFGGGPGSPQKDMLSYISPTVAYKFPLNCIETITRDVFTFSSHVLSV